MNFQYITHRYCSTMGWRHPKPRIRDFLRQMKVWTYFVFYLVLIFSLLDYESSRPNPRSKGGEHKQGWTYLNFRMGQKKLIANKKLRQVQRFMCRENSHFLFSGCPQPINFYCYKLLYKQVLFVLITSISLNSTVCSTILINLFNVHVYATSFR